MVTLGEEIRIENGQEVKTGRKVVLTSEGRKQGTYIAGITGTGKSTLLLNIALSDIEAGAGLCLLDPHGDLAEDVLARIPWERADDVILFDPSDIDHPFGLNLFECPDVEDPRLVDRVCSEIVGTFYKLYSYSWGPHLEDLLRNSVLTLLFNPGSTMLDLYFLLTKPEVRGRFLENITDPVVRTYWEDRFPKKAKQQPDWVASTLNKVDRFLANPVIRNIVSQAESTFDFRTVMDTGKILLVNLSKGKIGEENSSLLGAVLVGKILIAALSRAEIPRKERKLFHLIVDEYQSFATESFPTLQSEARKFNIDTIVAHQYRDQLDDLNRGSTLNVGNFIVFRVTGKDSFELASQFDSTPPAPELEREPVPYPTGRPGIFRSGDRGEFRLKSVRRRPFSDVAQELANRLSNLPNFEAWCKLIEGRNLVEYHIETQRPRQVSDPALANYIRQRSLEMARSREEVERAIEGRIARMTGEQREEVTYFEPAP